MDENELANYPGLSRRNGVWQVKLRVPSDLRHIEKREQIRESLGTTDRKEALERWSARRHEIVLAFKALREELGRQDRVETLLAAGKLDRLSRKEIERLALDWWSTREPLRDPVICDQADVERALEATNADEDGWEQRKLQMAEPAAAMADKLLVDAGVPSQPRKIGRITTGVRFPDVDKGSDAYRYLVQLVARAIELEADLTRENLLGQPCAGDDPLFNPSGLPSIASNKHDRDSRTIGDLIKEYRAERETLYGLESTRRKYTLLFRVMEEVWGSETLVTAVERPHCVEVLIFLRGLPPNASKRFPKLTLREAGLKLAAEELRPMSPNTITNYMHNLTAVLRWAERAEWGNKVNTAGLIDGRENQVQRRGFKPDELEKLFAALALFRDIDPAKFWVPALALFTGARAGEICQLRAEDIIQIGEVYCMNLTKFSTGGQRISDKRFKTASSERMVPLHPEIILSGFLKFTASVGPLDRLFPDLTPKPGYSPTAKFSKWFGRFKKGLGLNEPSLVFHSFRHGFRDACRDADISQETAEALGGWAGINQATKYGDRKSVPILSRAIQKVSFGEFSLPQ